MSAIKPWMSRTNLLFGEEKLSKVVSAHVLVVGLGGVGGVAAEMICRAGVKKMTLVDADTVEASNRNRQLPALSTTEGQLKAEVLGKRFKEINPDIELVIKPQYLYEAEIDSLLDEAKYDYVVDAIDTLSSKVALILKCIERRLPIVSSMGAGGRTDPMQVKIADISESHHCNLAKDVRKKLHRLGIYRGVTVVYSPETVDKSRLIITPDDLKKRSVIGTVSYMPAIFGCMVSSVVIRKLSERKIKKDKKED